MNKLQLLSKKIEFSNITITGVIVILLLLNISGCASLPKDYKRIPSYTLQDTKETPLAIKVAPAVADHPEQSGFYLLSSGMDAFVARVGLIDQAQRSLDIQYYIWHADTTGILLVDRLLNAADRGVRVRLLLDDLDTAGKDSAIRSLDAHPNIEIRLYNPFADRSFRAMGFVTDLRRVNRRMHNKSLTADNAATIVGGRNIGNEYFGATSHAEFSDLDVLALGPIVQDVSNMFDAYWNSDSVIPVSAFKVDQPLTKDELAQYRAKFEKDVVKEANNPYVKALLESNVLTRMQYTSMKFYWGESVLLYDDPSKVNAEQVTAETHLAPKLSTYINQAQQEVIIISPYFVPGTILVEYLGSLVKKGVRVIVLTNSLAANDVGVVHAGYMRYRIALLKRGVELYEFKSRLESGAKQRKKWMGSSNASLHAKTFAIDRRAIFVGSFNLDPRSVALNTEMGVLFESPEMVATLTDIFKKNIIHDAYRLGLTITPAEESDSGFEQDELFWVTIENGKEVRYNTDPDTSWWQRFSVGFLSIFVPESML
ncbi:phospholipase D family protein [Kaarinaea lacus]